MKRSLQFYNKELPGRIIVLGSRLGKAVIYKRTITKKLILTISRNFTKDEDNDILSVADPGFPVGGGVHPLGGAWTSDMGTFQ